MKKPISTRLHGVIDYSWAATANALAKRVNGATSTARLLQGAAAAATASSAITNYEYGAVRLMPMKGHLAMDFVLCSALVASPLFLPKTERRYAAIPLLLGATGLITGLLTKTRSPLEVDEEFGIFGGHQLSTTAELEEPAHLRFHGE
jgi:hypothetical protein